MIEDNKSEKESPKEYKGERSVYVYILSNSGSPKYQGKFDFRSFVMRMPNSIIVPYSPIDYPFPFLDVILPDFNSFLIIGEKTARDNKSFTKEIHHIIWKQIDHYKFVPYLFNFPLKYTKSHLLKLLLIQPKDENKYELWKIRDHQLYMKVNEGSPDDQLTTDKDNKKLEVEFDSVVMMKIIPYDTFNVKFHVRIEFYYIGANPRFIGTPLIFGLDKPEKISDLLHNFPNYAPKWVHNCEIRFLMKKSSDNPENTGNNNNDNNDNNNNNNNTNANNNNPEINYNDYIFLDQSLDNKNINEEPYFNVVCQLVDIDDYLNQ